MSQLCHKLHQLFQKLPVFRFPFEVSQIPLNGIYVLFEAGEVAHGTNRIVRIGTHTGNNNLRARISEHFIKENRNRSIFRRNIGRAILSRDKDPFIKQWEFSLTRKADRERYLPLINFDKQKEVEQQVTEYMRSHFSFVVFGVNDKDKRRKWETKIISTISLCTECRPSSEWLGQYSPKLKIRESGLWLVNELYKQPIIESEYEELQTLIYDNA